MTVLLFTLSFFSTLVCILLLRILKVLTQIRKEMPKRETNISPDKTGVVHPLPPQLHKIEPLAKKKEREETETGVVRSPTPAHVKIEKDREFRKRFDL